VKCKTCSRIKRGQTIEFKPIIKVKVVTALINMEDVNVTIRIKTSEEHVFKVRKPRKNKSTTNWEVEKKLKKFMVETMQ
jgi:hypothetical protein